MKKSTILLSVMIIGAIYGCNETVDPSRASDPKLVRIDYENSQGTSSAYFEYENNLLVKRELDTLEIRRYTYEAGILKTQLLELLYANILLRYEYRLEGDTLIVHHYANVNHHHNNFIDTDGLMLQTRTERYWISDNEIKEDIYGYHQGNVLLNDYRILTVDNENVYKAVSVQLGAGGISQTHEWEFLEEVKNPEHFQIFGDREFLHTNARIIKSYTYQGQQGGSQRGLTYELNEQGYPTMIRYLNSLTNDEDVTTIRYFYK